MRLVCICEFDYTIEDDAFRFYIHLIVL